MAYVLYSLSLLLFVLATVLYLTRARWTPLLPSPSAFSMSLRELLQSPSYLYSRLPSISGASSSGWRGGGDDDNDDGASFAADAEAGLTSSTFDLADNIAGGDARAGLDDNAKRRVRAIMRRDGVGFDEARRKWVQERFRSAGIGADGVPRDPKFVSFS